MIERKGQLRKEKRLPTIRGKIPPNNPQRQKEGNKNTKD